ncbi:MAG: hypothetical protein Q9160_005735 [Pyrenula sp. 1 TL-2023]
MSSQIASTICQTFPHTIHRDYNHLVDLAIKRFLERKGKEEGHDSNVDDEVVKTFDTARKNLTEEAITLMRDLYSLMKCMTSTIDTKLGESPNASRPAKNTVITTNLRKARAEILERIDKSFAKHKLNHKVFNEGISALHCGKVRDDDSVKQVLERLWTPTAAERLLDTQTPLPILKDVQRLPIPQHEIDELRAAAGPENEVPITEKPRAAVQAKSELPEEPPEEESGTYDSYQFGEIGEGPRYDDDPLGDEGDDLDDPVEEYLLTRIMTPRGLLSRV